MARLFPLLLSAALLGIAEADATPLLTMDRHNRPAFPAPDAFDISLEPCPLETTPPDAAFRKHRWPSIVAGSLWTRRQTAGKLPPPAAALIPVLKKAFAAEGLPQELVWVAEVESTLKTNALSATGALGLFQFKPLTARHFGLMPAPDDFRTEPEKSAKAAAQYLSRLYAQFGDWRLAVAAYNAGEGCVRRQLARNKAVLYEQIAADLPPQTQVYVIKVMATLALRENTRLSALPAPKRSSS